MRRIYCGIDLGLDGAVAWLDPAGACLQVEKMPAVKVKGRREVNVLGLATLLRTYPPYDVAVVMLEQVGTMGHEGRKSLWSFALGTGMVLATLDILGLTVVEVPPREWQKALLPRSLDTKEASMAVARKRWPTHFKGRHHGSADALCLAEYARLLGEGRRTSQPSCTPSASPPAP